MTSRGYTVLGAVVWRLITFLVKREIKRNRMKLGAAGVVTLVLIGGVVAAKSGSDD
jgi:hypothetical protein